MTSQPSTQWNLGRFVKTLSYFGAIPLLSSMDWFQERFGSRPNPKVDSRTIAYANPVPEPEASTSDLAASGLQNLGVILVAGATGEIGQQVIHQLMAQGHNLRSIDLAAPLPTDAMDQVVGVICCGDALELSSAAILALVQQSSSLGVTHQPIFNFAQPSSDMKEVWGALDDVVMGGVSESSLRLADGMAYFSGVVSTANSGGFASVRTRNLEPPLNLSEYDGIELQVKGDGKRYKVMVRTETRWDGVAHCYSFDTVADQWSTVRIPFSELTPVFRARTIDNSPLNLNQIYAWQLMLSKFEYNGALNPHFEPGFFQLQIKSIQVYRQSRNPKFVLVNPTSESELALKNSGIAYTIVHPSTLTDAATGEPLRVERQMLEGQVNIEDVAALCIAALEHPEARNKTFYITGGGDRALRDWADLFAR